jgi:hypothetical protein
MYFCDKGKEGGDPTHPQLICNNPFMPGARVYRVPGPRTLFRGRAFLLTVRELRKTHHTFVLSITHAFVEMIDTHTFGLWVTS